MVSSKKLLQLARKWQMAAAIRRKKISLLKTSSKESSGDSNEAKVTRQGHFAVYATDGRRFEIPVSYIVNGVIRDLLTIAEEEFGIPNDGPIVLPLDASSMEYLISLIRRGLSSGLEKASLLLLTRCSSHFTANTAPACP